MTTQQMYEYLNSEVTSEYYVDQYDNVYDAEGMFYCKWIVLNNVEKNIVKQNEFSAR